MTPQDTSRDLKTLKETTRHLKAPQALTKEHGYKHALVWDARLNAALIQKRRRRRRRRRRDGGVRGLLWRLLR